MKNSILIFCVFLSGCGNFILKPKFPTIPEELTVPCVNLTKVPSNEINMSEFLQTININYEKYYECKLKVELFNKWYQEQKHIYEELP